MWDMKLRISSQHINQLLQFAEKSAPQECCGVLLGGNFEVTHVILADNIAATPETHYEICPSVLIRSQKAERRGEAKLIGYFHSHPNGLHAPSVTDAEMATIDGKYHLIIVRGKVLCWQTTENGHHLGKFAAVALDTGA
jgi:desampylase